MWSLERLFPLKPSLLIGVCFRSKQSGVAASASSDRDADAVKPELHGGI